MVGTKNHAQKHTPLKWRRVSATGRLHTQQSAANTHTKGPLENTHEKGHKRHQNPQTQHTSNGPAWDIGRSGMRRTVQRDQPDGPALSQPRGQRHSPAPSRKRRTVRHRAPDGPTNVGQQVPSKSLSEIWDSNEDLNAARRESKAPTLGKHKHHKSQGLESQNQHKEGG